VRLTWAKWQGEQKDFLFGNVDKYQGIVEADFQLDKNGLDEFFNPVYEWMNKNKVPANRIWVGEFGCSRKVEGVEDYLKDLIGIFNQQNWHGSFYTYREDVWDDMDYELGTEKVFWKYWDYAENKILHLHYSETYGRVKNNIIWPVFQKEFVNREEKK